MPYDSNGNYSLPAVYKATPGTTIMTEQHNTPLEDIQSALNKAFLRDGSVPFLANVNANNFRITNVANGTNNGDAVNLSQLNGLLSNTALTGNTTSQNLTVSGTAIVPAVADWTTYQAVGAKDADARYVHTSGGPWGGIAYATIDSSGAPSFRDTNGVWHVVQPQGDYATNSALNAETSRAEAAESSLQSSKANLEGGNTWSGHQEIAGDLQIDSQANSSVAGSYNDGVVTNTLANRFGYKSVCGVREMVGQSLQAMISVYNGETWSEFDFHHSSSGGRITTPIGTVALTSELPLPAGQRIEAFTASTVYSNTRVNFPTGFSATPQSVVICDAETGNQVLWCKAKDWDAGGFTFMANANNTCPLISVVAIGNR